jgi:rubrerythrin
MDKSALYNIGYGLYVLTSNENNRDNGCMINTFMQVSSDDKPVCVICVNKQNYTHDMIRETGKFNVSVLTTDTSIDVIKHFGFQTGKNVDKFVNFNEVDRAENGILFLTKYTNTYMSFHVVESYDFSTHTMFRAELSDAVVLGKTETLTYSYYQKYIKPKPTIETQQKGYRCEICGYIHDSDELPTDFVCPICKHGAIDFKKISQENKVMSNLKGTKTEANLQEAFAGESQARNKYTYFAGMAKKEGYEQIAALFLETADNEKEHAKIWFKQLHDGAVPNTVANLVAAAAGEHAEWTDMYARMAREAREEGFTHIAFLFEAVGKIEKDHEARYLTLLKNIEDGKVFKSEKSENWHCLNCGYVHTANEAPKQCPVCQHPQSYFQKKADNY